MSRLRNIPGARERIAESPLVIQEPEQHRGHWRAAFSKEAPLFVEIGAGKGKFLTGMAAAHPENNYLGIEMYSAVLLKAVQRAEGQEALPNLRFLRFDATEIASIFAPGEAAGIYLNFSDPWPKDRHAHRRLTSDRFLARYEQILSPGGRLEFKTDNLALFDYSLEMLRERGWLLLACTRDLYGEQELLAGNVASEYEEKFSGRGNPICKLIAALGRADAAPAKN